MSLSRSRTITLVVAIATLTSNTLSTILFHQLPDDPYRLAANFTWYLHFANVLSVFGFIGALRQHALSITIFSNYLLLDTLLSSIPRLLLLSLLQPLSSTLCAPSSSSTTSPYSTSTSQIPSPFSSSSTQNQNQNPNPTSLSIFTQISEVWTEEGCHRILVLASWTMGAGVVAATLLQFVGALCVREYGRAIGRWEEMREREEELEQGLLDRDGDDDREEEEEEGRAGEKV